MKISVRRVDKAAILDVSGSVDWANSVEVRKVLLDEIREESVNRVVLNLVDVKYIDTATIASFIEGLKASRDKGSRLILFGLSEYVRESLKITQVLNLFDVCDNEEQAMII
jgi:anti-sigma B factor antagonist